MASKRLLMEVIEKILTWFETQSCNLISLMGNVRWMLRLPRNKIKRTQLKAINDTVLVVNINFGDFTELV